MNAHNNSENVATQPCSEWEPLLILSAAGGELDSSEQARLEAHVAQCEKCSASLAREKDLVRLLAGHDAAPDAPLLAACRAGLEDALDREEERGWLRRVIGPLLPSSWLTPSPARSAAVLLAIGFAVGVLAPRLFVHPAALHSPANASANAAPSPAAPAPPGTLEASASQANSATNSAPSTLDLHYADVAGINVLPSGGAAPPQVELRLKAQQPATVRGTVDDDDVKGLLLDVVRHSDRSNPDMCLSALDLLHSCNNDPEVRAVLCRVVRTNRNPAVRLKALEALDGSEPQDIFRQTLVDALAGDQNSGVRVEAIDELLGLAARGQVIPDDHMLSVLRNRMQNDPDDYVRAQSAAAIREISAKQ